MSDDDLDDDLDMDLDDIGEDDAFDDFGEQERTLGDLWRDNPMVKVGVIVGGVFFVIVLIFVLGGSKEPASPSYVPAGSDVKSAPGTEQASPAYIEAVEEATEERTETAIREGGSALPTPIEPPIGRLTVPEEEEEEEDPLQRWRRLQEERLEKELEQASVVTNEPQNQASDAEIMQALSEAMSNQMQAVLETRNIQQPMSSMAITSTSYLADLEKEREAELGIPGMMGGGGVVADQGNVLLPAAEVVYAQILTEANSDVPGPVLAQIVSGPLAGSRILGSFQVQNELLSLQFNKVVFEENVIPISAIALDPDTTLPAMATDVDHRYFRRVILPAAAAFVEGAASAISESGRTTVTVDNGTAVEETEEADDKQQIASGIEEAGQEVRTILDDMADDIEVLVRIEAGTPMAVLFLDSVVDNPVQPVPTAGGVGTLGGGRYGGTVPMTAVPYGGTPAGVTPYGGENNSP